MLAWRGVWTSVWGRGEERRGEGWREGEKGEVGKGEEGKGVDTGEPTRAPLRAATIPSRPAISACHGRVRGEVAVKLGDTLPTSAALVTHTNTDTHIHNYATTQIAAQMCRLALVSECFFLYI